MTVTLLNAAGETVIQEDAPVKDWVRSYALGSTKSSYYRQGATREIAVAGGGMRHEKLGFKASGGWGTYFYSEPGEHYTLNVRILEPFDHDATNARVTLVGWD